MATATTTAVAVVQNDDPGCEGEDSGVVGGGGTETLPMELAKEEVQEEECHDKPPNDDDDDDRPRNDDGNDDVDIWRSHNGYTPPMLLNGGGGGCWWDSAVALRLAAADPETDQPFAVVGPGEVNQDTAFCFGPSDGYVLTRFEDDADDQDEDDEDHQYHNDGCGDLAKRSACASNNTADEGELDFRAVADQALLALDDEYRATLRASAGGATAASTHPSLPPECEENEEALRLPPIRLPIEDFGDAFFVTDFDDTDNHDHTATGVAPNARPLPDVDVEAVKLAVQAIQGKNPALQRHLDEWQSSSLSPLSSQHQWSHWWSVAPRFHALIPAVPLSAFGPKLSRRAQTATAHLTRAATLADALHRLDLLQSQDCFRIDLVGCDMVECTSEAVVQQHLEPLVRWIGAYAESPQHVILRLVGPNVPESAPFQPVMLEVVAPPGGDKRTGRLQSATALCVSGLYHELCGGGQSHEPEPDLRVAFHAGIWGYSDWRATLEWMARDAVDDGDGNDRRNPIPFVVTAYTLQEAEDDADTLEAVLEAAAGWERDRIHAATVWRAEANAFASRVERETRTAPPGRVYRENAAWSCYRI